MHVVTFDHVFSAFSQKLYRHAIVENKYLNTVPHIHEFYEIIIIFSGSVTHIVNGNSHHIEEGDMVIVGPGESHCFSANDNHVDSMLSMQVETGEMETFIRAFELSDYYEQGFTGIRLELGKTLTRSIHNALIQLLSLDTDKHIRQYRIVISKIISGCLARTLHDLVPDWLRNSLNQMFEISNACEGVPAMLRLTNLSHSQLCRLIKKYYNQTPQQYIKNIRLNMALNLLVSTDDDMMEIAEKVGYNSYSHFYTLFKEQFGISPAEARRNRRILDN